MKKIISLFQRNYDGDRLVRDQVVPGAEWVLAGEGVATRKYDGVCTMVRDGKLYKRLEITDDKRAAGKVPAEWEPTDERDDLTAKQMGWIPVGEGPEDKYLREALDNTFSPPDGTYEFLGPKSQGNVEGFEQHYLLSHEHGCEKIERCPRTFEGLRVWLSEHADGIILTGAWRKSKAKTLASNGGDERSFGDGSHRREARDVPSVSVWSPLQMVPPKRYSVSASSMTAPRFEYADMGCGTIEPRKLMEITVPGVPEPKGSVSAFINRFTGKASVKFGSTTKRKDGSRTDGPRRPSVGLLLQCHL